MPRAAKNLDYIFSRQNIETFGIIGGAVAAFLAIILGYFILQTLNISKFSLTQFGFVLGIEGFAVVFIAFLMGYRQAPEGFSIKGRFRVVRRASTSAALAFAHASITFLICVALANISTQYIKFFSLDDATTLLIISVSAALFFYVSFVLGASMTSSKLVNLLVAFIISGVLASIVTAGDSHWWTHHFSALGAGGTTSSYAFNLTMILGGMIIIGLVDYIMIDLASIDSISARWSLSSANIIRILFIIIGISMIGIAIFPYDSFYFVHNVFGYGMSLVFLTIIFILPWIVPFLSKIFFAVSYVAVFLGLFSYYAWCGLDRISFITFELILGFIIFIWLVLFVRQINAVYADNQHFVESKGYPISVRKVLK